MSQIKRDTLHAAYVECIHLAESLPAPEGPKAGEVAAMLGGLIWDLDRYVERGKKA